jgi:iron complex outermembrane recepter protein
MSTTGNVPAVARSLLVLLACSGTAVAQDSGTQKSAEGPIQDIVVTALKREEKLTEVPAAVAVFGEDMIERANISRPTDFVQMIPNAALIDSNTEGEAFLVLRGIAPARNGETSTAIVVDGVLSGGPNELAQDFFDIQQIEVLKGPQGALYGRNAVGGAVIVTTKPATNEFEGRVKIGGGEAGRVMAQGTVSGPVIKDQLFGRFAYLKNERGGKLINVETGEERDRFDRQTMRGDLRWEPLDTLTVSLRGGTSRMRDSGGIAFTASIVPEVLDVNNDFPDFENNTRSFNDQDKDNASLKIDWDAGFGTFTSVSAYSFVEDTYGQDNFPYLFGDFGFDDEGNFRGGNTQWVLFGNTVKSQELRFTSPGDKRLRFIVGAYYADIENDRVTNLAQDLISVVRNGRRPNGPETGNPTFVFRDDEIERENFAYFGQIAFDILDNLEVAFAYRNDDEDAKNTDLAPADFTTTPGLVRKDNYSKGQPKLTVNWEVVPGNSVYASYGEGFKAGGFNPFGTAALVQASNPLSTVRDEYGEETSKSYEAGFKTQFLDGRVRFNGAFFQTDAKNFQVFEFFPGPSLQAIAQVEKVDIRGFEFDVTWAVTDDLVLSGGYGDTDSEVDELASNPSLEGNKMPYTPDSTLQLAADYTYAINEDLGVSFRTDFNRIGKTRWDLINTPGATRDPVNLLKARVGLGNDTWEISAWVDNLLNEKYYAETVVIFPGPLVSDDFAVAAGASFRAAPRFWGIDFSYRF